MRSKKRIEKVSNNKYNYANKTCHHHWIPRL